jgi:hypothetical protein
MLTFLAKLFDIPIRVVDTAGFEGTHNFDPANLSARKLNKAMV